MSPSWCGWACSIKKLKMSRLWFKVSTKKKIKKRFFFQGNITCKVGNRKETISSFFLPALKNVPLFGYYHNNTYYYSKRGFLPDPLHRGRNQLYFFRCLFGCPQGPKGCQTLRHYSLSLDLDVCCSNIEPKLNEL